MYDRILEYVSENDADLITMGTRGQTGLKRYLLGSVAEQILRESPVPVLTTEATEGSGAVEGYSDVLVPTDGSDPAERATDHALALAERFGATLHVVSAVDVQSLSSAYGVGGVVPSVIEDLEERHEETVDSVAERAEARNLDVTTGVPQGAPARLIREYVTEHDIDLVAMGTHGRSGLDRYILGSIAERTVRTAPAPVLAVPP